MEYQDILARYPDAQLLKKGGQKQAYRVSHPDYGMVVLKVGTYESPRSLERIKREVATLKEIESPYYPKHYEFQVDEKKRFIILEEYIESLPLSACLTEYSDPKKALLLIRDLVIGLKVIWDKNIVHRDIKPDNILITPLGEAKIIDLGIARLLDLESLTTVGRAPLTRAYAAPEQIRPNPGIKFNHRTDQFNLGIILVQLLLKGAHPFDPNLVNTGYSYEENILSGRWHNSFFNGPTLSKISPLASKLLGHEQFQRYRTPDLLLEGLDSCLTRLP